MTRLDTTDTPWHRSLEAQLVAGFLLVALLPVALVAGLLTWQGRKMAESFVSEHVEKTAQAYASGLDLYVERHRGHLRELSSEGIDEQRLSAAVQAEPSLVALWRHGQPTAAGMSADRWAQDACAALALDPENSATHAGEGHAHEVVIAVRAGSETLCGQLSFTPHQEMMTQQTDSFLGGSAYIVDRDGVVVCYAFEDDHPHVPRGDVLSARVAEVAAAGARWSGEVLTPGDPRFAAFASAEGLPWGVWVDVPRDKAFAPFRQGMWRAGMLTAVIAVIAAAFAVLLGRRLAAPVHSLALAAARVAQGELGASVPVTGPAELATLSEEFNAMSVALAASHADLEARVQTRTRELAQARAFSDRLLDTMRQRILVLDPDERIIRANQAAIQAYGPEIIGKTSPFHTESPSTATQVMHSHTPQQQEHTITQGDKTEVLAVETVPLLDDNSSVLGALQIAQDVTELRRIRARLAQQEKMAAVGTLAAGLAHEIGNPLASMSSELEMLERLWDPEDARNALPVLRDQVRRMTSLLRELVDFGRPAADHITRFELQIVLEEVARLLRHDPRGHQVEVKVQVESELALITSRDRLIQVLLNLGLNALDVVDRGTVTLRAMRCGEQEVCIEVEDDGPGVSEELSARVFDPFFTSKQPGRGTGLGLFVSERIVQRLGGRIELRQSTLGACFLVVLPTSPVDPRGTS